MPLRVILPSGNDFEIHYAWKHEAQARQKNAAAYRHDSR